MGHVTFMLLALYLMTGINGQSYESYDYSDSRSDDVTCFSPWIINGIIKDQNGQEKDSFNPGETANVICNTGYQLADSHMTQGTCQDNRTWSWGDKPRCIPLPPPPPQCTSPKIMAYAMHIAQTQMAKNDTNVYWKLKVNCTTLAGYDYRLHGNGEYVCEGTEWKGVNFCIKRRLCPRIQPPKNGAVALGDLNNRRVGSEVHFKCNRDYILEGDRVWKCLPHLRWSTYTVYCEKDQGILGMAQNIRENVINKFKASTTSAGNRGRLSSSNVNGIDLFFLVDRSDSIAREDFTKALEFIKVLIDVFGISCQGGATRLAIVSFGTLAKVDLSFDHINQMEECIIKKMVAKVNLDDMHGQWVADCMTVKPYELENHFLIDPPMIPTSPENLPDGVNKTVLQAKLKELVKRKIALIQPSGGGTNIHGALSATRKLIMRRDAEKAVFLLSDGRDNVMGDKELESVMIGLRRRVNEFFTIGIGPDVNVNQLKKIASHPFRRHVFQLRNFQELEQLRKNIITKKDDLRACGVSVVQRNKEAVLDATKVQIATKRSWPWLVKIANEHQGRFICAGSLIEKNYVLTSAYCLFKDGIQKETSDIYLTAGFYDETGRAGWQESPADDLIIHPNFNLTQPYLNDVALIKTKDEFQLGAFVRTVCVPDETTDRFLFNDLRDRWLVGWDTMKGSLPELPVERVMPKRGEVECRRGHPVTSDVDYLQCLGDKFEKLGHCAGDRGSPIVVPAKDLDDKPIYKVAAIVTDGSQCNKSRKYTVVTVLQPFMDWIRKAIPGWDIN